MANLIFHVKKSGLWVTLWRILTERRYKEGEDSGMLLLFFFLRCESGYRDMLSWDDLSGYLRFVHLSLYLLYFKTRKAALMMENSGIEIEVLYNSNMPSLLGCFEKILLYM